MGYEAWALSSVTFGAQMTFGSPKNHGLRGDDDCVGNESMRVVVKGKVGGWDILWPNIRDKLQQPP